MIIRDDTGFAKDTVISSQPCEIEAAWQVNDALIIYCFFRHLIWYISFSKALSDLHIDDLLEPEGYDVLPGTSQMFFSPLFCTFLIYVLYSVVIFCVVFIHFLAACLFKFIYMYSELHNRPWEVCYLNVLTLVLSIGVYM